MDEGDDGGEPVGREAGGGGRAAHPGDASSCPLAGASGVKLVPALPPAAQLAGGELVSIFPLAAPLALCELFPTPSPPASSLGDGLGSAPSCCPLAEAAPQVISKIAFCKSEWQVQ
jgi:hypothetical protein